MASQVVIITDSNCGITQQEAKNMNINVIPMPFSINGEVFFEDISLSQEMFYEKLKNNAVVSTSQPAVGDITALWDAILKDYDEIVHIPMSSGLSTSCQSAIALAADYNGKVQIVNNQRISVTMRQSVIDAINLAGSGKSAVQIRDILESTKFDSGIYIMLDTLQYLKKGGRITPAAAAIGTVLNLKPVLQIQGEKLDAYAKARGLTQARKIMLNAVKKDFETKLSGNKDVTLHIAYTYDYENAVNFSEEVKKEFPGYPIKHIDPLSLSVSCHIGPGALAVAWTKNLKFN